MLAIISSMSNPVAAMTSERPTPHRPLILAACMAASFMAAVEATIMATAMPAIATSLGGFSLFAWVFSAYMLGQAATIPLYGRLADIYGRRNVFFGGVFLFLLGSTLCGFSQSMPQLVLFRAIQGLGAGGVQPIANTIVGDIYTPVERARVQGLLSGVFGVSAVIGPSLGAFIVQYGDWPVVFWINLPIGVAAIIMIALFLPEDIETRPRRVDYLGSILLMVSTGALLLLIQATGVDPPVMAAMIAVVLITGTGLALHQRRVTDPMLPLELWHNRVIVGGSVGSLVTGILMMGVTAYLPTYIQGVMGGGADDTAVILAIMSVVWVLGSTTAGLWLPRASYRRIATSGALALIAGAFMLIVMTPERGPVWAGIGAALIGVGMGFSNTTYMVSVQTSVAWHQRGAATSSTMFLRFFGQSLGAAAFGAVVNASLFRQVSETSRPLDHIMDQAWRARATQSSLALLTDTVSMAMRNAYCLTGIMALLALLLALNYPAKLGPANQPRLK